MAVQALGVDDYMSMPIDGRRHEVIGGQHYMHGSPGTAHQMVSGNLLMERGPFIRAHGLGTLMIPINVKLSDHDIVQPDLSFISRGRRTIVTEWGTDGAPDLAIEILADDRDYDEITKRDVYERYGVAEYWVVDPEDDVVTIHRRSAGAFVRVDVGDIITTPLLPGFELLQRHEQLLVRGDAAGERDRSCRSTWARRSNRFH